VSITLSWLGSSMEILSYGGIDACRSGWIMTVMHKKSNQFMYRFSPTFSGLVTNIKTKNESYRFLVDMPIGLLPLKNIGQVQPNQRSCDMQARKILGKRHSSIFSPPCLQALYEQTYSSASTLNFTLTGKKISKQSWNIFQRIREVNEFLHQNHWARSLFFESHPELAYQKLNNHTPLQYSKKTNDGILERLDILSRYHPESHTFFSNITSDKTMKGKMQKDDVVDALVLSILNSHRDDKLSNITEEYQEDQMGLRMGIWW